MKNDFSKDNTIINFYEIPEVKKFDKNKQFVNKYFKNTNINLPARIGLIGATGSGKSNILINFLTRTPDTFTKIIIVHKLDEKLYDFLKEQLGEQITFYKGLNELPRFKDLELNNKDRLLMIFDDVVNDSKKIQEDIILEYFLLGRKVKSGITMFYLSQSYYKIPKSIREQFSYILIVKLRDNRDIKTIINNNTLGINDTETINYLYNEATKNKGDFLKIDLYNQDVNKIFSRNWIEFFTLNFD
jgi:ABC-type dipeptide/oligopeptide/nickel transport system ATPase component